MTTAPVRTLPKPLRRGLLTLHVITSVGWLGISLGNIALALTVYNTSDPALQHSIYRVLEIVGNIVILPISLTAFATGVVLSVGTHWGLLRHKWVLIKLVLTLGTVLMTYLSLVPGLRESAAIVDATAPDRLADIDGSGLLSAAFVSSSIYTFNVVLSTFKPWGRTRWGRRAAEQARTRVAARV
ncbi:hypothetical protein [Stackebrandtia nassauensis]|uniref:Putative integral membrane protein n=1 Tax=Stackebrandtia nassauensis (strain DSM 44728 / CIP 108903 / NRRL B-16338 / NBRC 102104 / LLR-40K-21) TaxID=446470 RepID=D3Q592_STANL|nr:hypothetical protein [Stackebrandtia nassauensis]ADD44141.1 putative integral membrane protein [Stackebrandtia nassauensis DSM 44728]